jgi:hydrogenase expression/formation protein HypE
MSVITLSHGSGGKQTHKLIEEIFYKYFKNEILFQKNDSSIVQKINGRIAVTTDSFVIKPIFFPGGDIGKLSVCGTINDLSVSGAVPMYITAGFIIEEGLDMDVLEKIVVSMAKTVENADVKIIAGDTKVVEKGNADEIFINTTGIGLIQDNQIILNAKNIQEGDKVIISGTLGDHGMCIMSKREGFNFNVDIKSDCDCLNKLTKDILNSSSNIRIMKDPTRGGLATTLNEITQNSKISIILNEKDIPVKKEVLSMCEILGFDPLHTANEGKVIVIVSREDTQKVLEKMKKNPLGREAKVIGKVINDNKGSVYLKTEIGGTRIIDMSQGEQLPRIC